MSSQREIRMLARPVIYVGFAALCASVAACVASTTPGSPSDDAGEFDAGSGSPDATVPDAGGGDAAHDSSTGSTDAGGSDAAPDAADAGTTCATLLNAAFGAAISPPNQYLGLNLATGGGSDGGVGSGGLTIDESGLLACAASVEPTALDAGVLPNQPGFRLAAFNSPSDPGTNVAQIEFNVESRVIEQVLLSPGYTGQLQFHSRAGGAYGTHQYVISIEGLGDAGTSGEVLRDGVSFAADWGYVTDAGAQQASPWANELYDGLMATFAPAVPAVADCLTSQFTGDILGIPETATDCLFIPNLGTASLLGARQLAFYLEFNTGTNQVQFAYNFWPGGLASCATPQAAVEKMTDSFIGLAGYFQGTAAFGLGGTFPMLPSSNPLGLTDTELNTVFGCGGTSWAPPDTGYGGMQWGSGQVATEFNIDSGVNYKVYAQAGYVGTWAFSEADGGAYTFGIGSATLGTAPVTIDWSDAASADATITSIANAWYNYNFSSPPDTDCSAQGDCTIVANDGHGHSTFSLSPSVTMQDNYSGAVQTITVVFAQGSSTPEQIYVTNPGGQ
jgi:hypothetical protein